MKLILEPAAYDEKVLYAVRAFWDGKANDGQQIIVRDWILMHACGLGDNPLRLGADGSRLTDIHLGRQFVARQLVDLTKPAALEALKRRTTRARKAAAEKEAKE